jgi:hypothetical protein
MSSVARALWFREALFIVPLLVLGVFLAYSPVVQTDFLFRDDCVFFTVPKGWTLTPIALSQARPLQGVIVDVLNSSIVPGAGLKRLVPVLGLGMLAIAIYSWLRRNGLGRAVAMLLSLSLCCLSSFQDTVCYLTVCSSIYASLLGCLAVQVFFGDWGNPAQSRPKRLLRATSASALLLLGLSLYQPGAMFCWALLVVPVYLVSSEDWPSFSRAMLRFGLMFGVTMVAYVLLYKVVSLLMAMSLSGRAGWANPGQLLSKLAWFWTHLVPQVGQAVVAPLHAFTPLQLAFLGLLSLALALGGLCCLPDRRGPSRLTSSRLQRLVLLPLLVMLCYLPFIVVPERGVDPIYTTGIQSSLVLAVCLGLRNLLDLAASLNVKRRVEVGFFVILFCLLAMSARGNMLHRYVCPNHGEYNYMRSVIAKADLTKIKRIHVVGHLNFSDVLSYPEALARGVVNEVAPPGAHPEITSSSKTAPSVIHPEILARNEAVKQYYRFDARQGFYFVKSNLTSEQRAALDSYFAAQAKTVAALPNVLVIDLSKVNPAY